VCLHGLLALVLGLSAAAPAAGAAAQGRATAEPADRWQITLKDGSTLWDLRLVKLGEDTLVFQGNASILRFPLMRVDELRLVRKATRSITPETGRYGGVLDGADDEVLAERAHALADAAGAELLAVEFDGPRRDARFVDASLWPDLRDGAIADAMLALVRHKGRPPRAAPMS